MTDSERVRSGVVESCEFCTELTTATRYRSRFEALSRSSASRLVSLFEDFVLLPSLGPLTQGHTLLVPRVHVHAFADANCPSRLETVLTEARGIVEQEFGRTSIFEHGTWAENSKGGCGIRHAHVHLVPDTTGSIDRPREFSWQPLPTDGWVTYLRGHRDEDYLLLWRDEEHPWAAFDDSAPSQILRRFMADQLEASAWNWRDIADADGLIDTTLRLRRAVHSATC